MNHVEGTTMDVDPRLEVYFIFTSIAAVAELVDQEFSPYMVFGTLLWRLATCYVLYYRKVDGSHYAIRMAMAVSYALAAAYWMNESPRIWDSTLWTILLDSVMAVWMVLTTQLADGHIPCETCTEIFCLLYTASGFFKLNYTFLDPDVSCATVFMAQHVAYYLDGILPPDSIAGVLAVLKPYSPLLIVVVELSMGGFISLGRICKSRGLTTVGLYFILYFHLAVCLTPRPNDISMFAVKCGARLVLLLEPKSLQKALTSAKSNSTYLATVVAVAVAWGVQLDFTIPNWGFAVYTCFLAFIQWTMLLEESPGSTLAPITVSSKKSRCRPLWTKGAVVLSGFHAFGSIILGLQELAAPNMYSNLKTHGGSNHMLVPTGLLFSYFRDDNSHPFGGGIVRIEGSDSQWLRTVYPADMTHVLQPTNSLVSLLESTGSRPPIFFNCSANRILRLFERGWVQHVGNFVPYTVPALEFKRIFSEALAKDGTFELVYALLPGTMGTEVWRATAVERRVVVRAKDGEVAACEVHSHSSGVSSECTEFDLPYQLKLPWLIQKIAMFHGYPILFEPDGSPREKIMCFGT